MGFRKNSNERPPPLSIHSSPRAMGHARGAPAPRGDEAEPVDDVASAPRRGVAAPSDDALSVSASASDDDDATAASFVPGGPPPPSPPSAMPPPDWAGDTVDWLRDELLKLPIARDYPAILDRCVAAMRRWRDEMPKPVWLRLVKSGRVAKELNECAPVIDRCLRFLDERVPVPPADPAERVNVLDLCSGFGYLGMFLSECLDPERCQRIILVDKQWPMHGDPRGALPHQINWDHVYGCEVREGDFLRPEVFEDPERVTRRFDATEYYAARGNNKRTTPGDGNADGRDDGNDDEDDDAQKKKTPLVPHFWRPRWPVPLATRKMDVKQAGQLRQMERHVFQKHRGPFVILAVHLCGTLSIKAVEMFNHHPTAAMFALKPCCLPEWAHTNTHVAWNVGGHCIPCAEVCAKGKWKANRWVGPPRSHLRAKFAKWCDHLYDAIAIPDAEKSAETIEIQTEGGHQNRFVFAERAVVRSDPSGHGATGGRYAGEECPHEFSREEKKRRAKKAEGKTREGGGEEGFRGGGRKFRKPAREPEETT